MTSKYRAEDKERGLLADAWEYVRLSQGSYDVHIGCELRASKQRGVFDLYWFAKSEHQNGSYITICSYTTSYPTAQHSTLAGALLRGSVEIDRLVDAWALGLAAAEPRPERVGE
jgi:hypothetical protein